MQVTPPPSTANACQRTSKYFPKIHDTYQYAQEGKHCRNIFSTCKPQSIHIKDEVSTPAVVSNKTEQ